jgi:3-phosphoshikimate 1-carboxyvinyltransferase
MAVKIKYCEFPSGIITPVTSKSISNRALIIHALTGNKCELKNLSNSDDTNSLIALLAKLYSNEKQITFDAGPAGTVMRFLVTLACLSEKEIIVTGSKRMLERPMGNLINALRKTGANISCLEKEGFAPVKISPSKIVGGKIVLESSVSSQFISSLLLCAPYFENGIEIKLAGKTVSASYINMTMAIMKHFGVDVLQEDKTLIVKKGNYIPKQFTVEADWSSASYFYSLAAFSKNAEIELTGLRLDSTQGDSAMALIATGFGVTSHRTQGGIVLKKINCELNKTFAYDFLQCPDIAQTVIPMVAAKGIENGYFHGLSTLKLKETDRIVALKNELTKFNVGFSDSDEDQIAMNASNFKPYKGVIHTYDDHRMAMGFAPLAQVTGELIIENEATVKKSYVRYWDDLKTLGCIVENYDI